MFDEPSIEMIKRCNSELIIESWSDELTHSLTDLFSNGNTVVQLLMSNPFEL
jgi:hypothetical protein